MKSVIVSAQPDCHLVADCLKGNLEAFGSLVQRYQALVCALIYSRCGNAAQSEDLAQETFIAAWQSLPSLQDASHFKAWLCQIARNVSANSARAEARKVQGHRSPMEALQDVAAITPTPARDAMVREEESMVWRTLDGLPENYRLPLILFHREGESIAAVAQALDISEDAAKQRLARGRALLKREVNDVVESVLSRTKPGAHFIPATLSALGAMGGMSVNAAGIGGGDATNAVIAGKTLHGVAAGLWLAIIPLIGDWFLWRFIQKSARTHSERHTLGRWVKRIVFTDLLFTGWIVAVIQFAAHSKPSNAIILALVAGSAVGFLALRSSQVYLALCKAKEVS